MELDIHDLSKITGICESSLITYLDGVFSGIHRIKRKSEKGKRCKYFYIVSNRDINKLKLYKMRRMRKY